MKKYGHGDVLPEDEEERKTAVKNWTEEDEEALAKENVEADEE